ncbi:hypothetical protein AYL99_10471 [Fonsecaea erecta]|uniref:Nucleolar 27S pre-rRNA processing Urb2/Npa2 C-terminal domain-containing protein n=1 Tax=Fonsecaea erecta TaxID=1367422 RepID=A0A178Z6U3_9EURO|nr:hypothetical protein AYL99_10471 [Fonsecaea erecta]OAP55498.1 hypothetical protein AYL99_10471 [Fonsecaea erecta]
MAKDSFEARMAGLEKAKGPPEKILEEAARILELDLETTLTRCATEPLYIAFPKSHGFKEQWVLRWLLKKLGALDKSEDGEGKVGASQKSFIVSPKFWSLLLNLSRSIPGDVCSEILLERDFQPLLVSSIRELLHMEGSQTNVAAIKHDHTDGRRPTKRRRLSPELACQTTVISQETLLWLALQTGTRCAGLSTTSTSSRSAGSRTAPVIKTATWSDHAALLGCLLEVMASIMNNSTDAPSVDLLSTILETLLSSWDAVAPTTRKKDDGQDPAFSSQCLLPCLHLLDILAKPQWSHGSFARSRLALERLIALHVVFPLRLIFNEQFTKKWRVTKDVLLFEQMETLLKAYNNPLPVESKRSQRVEAHAAPGIVELSWIILDVAARSIPISDFRRRQVEQPFVDSLFIWLVHVSWPRIPHIMSTGVLQQPLPVSRTSEIQDTWALSLERLIEVAHARKLQLSLQIITYVLQAVLTIDTESAPWNLLVKIIQLDLNTLIPHSGLASSAGFLEQVLDRIQSSTVSQATYVLLRDQIVCPLLHSFARSRDLDGFVTGWQRMLAEAIRVRYTSRHNQADIPAVLIWEDEDIFDELKPLINVYAPPNMGQRMLESLVEPIDKIGDKVGSTAEVFAKLAIFCAVLESPWSETRNIRFDHGQPHVLLLGAMNALSRNSDYQGQRWRLWRLIGLLLQMINGEAVPVEIDTLLSSAQHFVSLKDIRSSDQVGSVRQTAKNLEHLECFSLLLQLAAQSKQHQPRLEAEVGYLADVLQSLDEDRVALWDGRNARCSGIHDLVAACIGKLLQTPEIFFRYPESFKALVQACLERVFQPLAHDAEADSLPNLRDLLLAVLEAEDISRSPLLRQLIFEHVDKNLRSTNRSRKICMRLLSCLSMETMKRPVIKGFVASTLRRLFDECRDARLEAVSDDLCLLAWLDSVFPGALTDYGDWQKWIDFAAVVLRWNDEGSLQLEITNYQKYMSSYVTTLHILDRVFQSIRSRTLAVLRPKAKEIVAYMVTTARNPSVPLFCLRIFLDFANGSGSALEKGDQHKNVEFLRELLARRVKQESNKALSDASTPANLLRLQLLVDMLHSLDKDFLSDELRHIESAIQEKLLHAETHSKEGCAVKQNWRKDLSLRPQSIKSTLTSDKQHVQELASFITPLDLCTNTSATLLATEAEVFACQLEPTSWLTTLEALQHKSEQAEYQPACAVLVACILRRIKMQHMLQYPALAQAVAGIVCMDATVTKLSTSGLLLTLENCLSALELHPLVVNQSVLDRLLATIHAVVSARSDGARCLQTRDFETDPQPADIFQRVCGVIGAILGRHRKRLTDRYHLLLPILQNLLRCLFWTGQKVLESQRGDAANATRSFAKSLPNWLHVSAEPLPQSSAEQFARLLSSISNPTVSAARSSNKGGRNELNDAVNQARKLAGQHMQYLVMEYCRCALDGQITPATKDSLMPGMYRVMDALDRDVMRAMNAGMDPSSRTIFKALYDSWVRYGKWDKS